MSIADPRHSPPLDRPPMPVRDDQPGTPATTQDGPRGATADLMTRVVKGAHETIDTMAEQAGPPLERLAQGLAQTGETLHDKADQFRATGDAWAESLRASVREHPLAALAAALAVGVVIARLAR